jgi:hypothetical protein
VQSPEPPATGPSRSPTQGPLLVPVQQRPHYVRPVPIKKWDIYVDNFIGLIQGGPRHCQHVNLAYLSTLDTVFRRLSPSDGPFRQEPASIKKMQKGGTTWATIPGWTVDTLQMTIELPAHRVTRLFDILDSVPSHQGRTSAKKWQKLLGELRSIVLAIPGGRGMFSVLQNVLDKRCNTTARLRLTKPVHAILADFRRLAQDLATRPTRLAKLVPTDTPRQPWEPMIRRRRAWAA